MLNQDQLEKARKIHEQILEHIAYKEDDQIDFDKWYVGITEGSVQEELNTHQQNGYPYMAYTAHRTVNDEEVARYVEQVFAEGWDTEGGEGDEGNPDKIYVFKTGS